MHAANADVPLSKHDGRQHKLDASHDLFFQIE